MVLCVCTMLIRYVLGLLNTILLILSLLVLSGGILLLVDGGKVLLKLYDVSKKEVDDLHVVKAPELSWLDALPMGSTGAWLCAGSTCLAALAILGLVSAIRPQNMIMWTFVVVMSILALCCIVAGSLFLCRDSDIHDALRPRAAKQLKEHYDSDGDGDGTFTKAIDALQYYVDCCGIQGPGDYVDGPPASCCNHTMLMGRVNHLADQCNNGTLAQKYYRQKGCYDRVLDLFIENKGFLAFYVIFVLIQALEALLGFVYLLLKKIPLSTVGPG
ncbi:leukocyte surface antigen CD53-like [Littorina saxatilis]|uniref:Tetraspanin n=1 Tax=Littorina saxatilis TaxID=31220 RepID=A0AAN9BJ99_9CAEN